MNQHPEALSGLLPLKFKNHSRAESWWAPIWRGLIVEPNGKHYRALRTSIWLYLYLIIHADRKTGTLFRRIGTMANDMGVEPATIRRWLSILAKRGYISRKSTGRSLQIAIERWKRLQPSTRH